MANIILFPRASRPFNGRHAEAFLSALELAPEFARGGYSILRARSNEFALARNGHVLGVWRIVESGYTFTPTSYRVPTFSTTDLEGALGFARRLVSPSVVLGKT